MTDDMTCKEFAELLKTRDAHYPLSDRYVEDVHDSPDKSGDDEREHMIIWFEANDKTGTGPYSRSTPNTSARRCYARLGNAGSLLWIAEAVGVPTETVRRAFDAAVKAGNYRRACGAIRAIIPWSEVCSRARELMR